MKKIETFWNDYYNVYKDTTNYNVDANMLNDLAKKMNEIIDWINEQKTT